MAALEGSFDSAFNDFSPSSSKDREDSLNRQRPFPHHKETIVVALKKTLLYGGGRREKI
jgi:hypothetical protein